MVFASSSRHRAGNDHILAVLPVDRRRHPVLGGELHRVDHAQHLVEVAACGHRIDQDELDLLVGADDEDVAHRLVVGRRASLRGAGRARRQHAVELGDGEVRVADHRKVRRDALRLLDVVGPLLMEVDRIDTEADDLDAALVELRLDPRHIAELGGADRSEVLGVREQHAPGIAEPFMEPDVAFVWCRPRNPGRYRRVGVSSYSPLLDEGEGPAPGQAQ